ncbi:MAG: alpha/beta hydrolase [Actinomycetota bacterium]
MSTLTAADAADLFRRAPDRHIDVGAGEAAYRTVGSGPDVLFVHGFPVSGATFRRLLPHLADHVRCHVIDLPGAGDSRFDDDTVISLDQHIVSVRRVVDELGLDDVAVVGHDSGGMIARHALAGDDRVRSWGLINTEQPQGLNWRFKSFLAVRNSPGLGSILGWISGRPLLRRNKFVFGDAFADKSLLEGEFDEFFLQPLATIPARRRAAAGLLKTFDTGWVGRLGEAHRRMDEPVKLVWGAKDPFFPVQRAREMVDTFPDASITVIDDAGLFSHEERPAEVAAALLPTLLGKGS